MLSEYTMPYGSRISLTSAHSSANQTTTVCWFDFSSNQTCVITSHDVAINSELPLRDTIKLAVRTKNSIYQKNSYTSRHTFSAKAFLQRSEKEKLICLEFRKLPATDAGCGNEDTAKEACILEH
jgi:hypothetical protein